MSCETITLTAYDNAGATINSINIDGNIVYGTDYYDVPYNQTVVQTLDGGQVSHGTATFKKKSRLIIKSLSKTDGQAFKDFLRDDLVYRSYYLGIGLNGALVNIGNGEGIDITYSDRAKILNETGKGLSEMRAPGNYDINLDVQFT